MDSNSQFECGVCGDDFDDIPGSYVVLDEYKVCKDCFMTEVKPQFEEALKYESKWPVRFGSAVLNIDDFQGYFDYDMVLRYHNKEKEYRTPVGERLYCDHIWMLCDDPDRGLVPKAIMPEEKDDPPAQLAAQPCNDFIGSSKDLANDSGYVSCHSCQGLTHIDCGKPMYPPVEDHRCVKVEDAFEGLTQGKDFQLCPNERCGVKCQLIDGCNNIVCPNCATSFCFICGKEASHDSNHWTAGGCPRWNAAGAPNAHFDQVRTNDNGEDFDHLVDWMPVHDIPPLQAQHDPAQAMAGAQAQAPAVQALAVQAPAADGLPVQAPAAQVMGVQAFTAHNLGFQGRGEVVWWIDDADEFHMVHNEAVAEQEAIDAANEGIRLLDDRHRLHEVAHSIRDLIVQRVAQGQPIPAWSDALGRLMLLLWDNLQVYTLHLRRRDPPHFDLNVMRALQRRHRRIHALLPLPQEVHDMFPILIEILLNYQRKWHEQQQRMVWPEWPGEPVWPPA